MLNGVKFFSGSLILLFLLSGCGSHHGKVDFNRTNKTFDFDNRPSITQNYDGTFIYRDKKYAGADNVRFGF